MHRVCSCIARLKILLYEVYSSKASKGIYTLECTFVQHHNCIYLSLIALLDNCNIWFTLSIDRGGRCAANWAAALAAHLKNWQRSGAVVNSQNSGATARGTSQISIARCPRSCSDSQSWDVTPRSGVFLFRLCYRVILSFLLFWRLKTLKVQELCAP